MKKFLLWMGGVLVFIAIIVSCLVLFYPDQKLESFDDLKLNLPNISEEQNGYKYTLEAYKAYKLPDGFQYPDLNDFFKSDKLEDIKKFPDFYPLLKANSTVLKAIDTANEFDYLIPDTDLEGKDLGTLYGMSSVPDNFVNVNKLLIARVLYKLQQENNDGALDNLLDLIKFQNKNIFLSTALSSYLLQENLLNNSLSVLRLILNNIELNEDKYISLLNFFDDFKANSIIGRENALKFEFNFSVNMRKAMVNDVGSDYLSKSKFHYQPNKTTNTYTEYFRKIISDPNYSPEKDMLELSKKYNNNPLMLFLSPNSYGDVLTVTFMPNFSFFCTPLLTTFNSDSLRLLVAIKLYEIKNMEAPAGLEDLVPDYFKDLNWLNFNNERTIDYKPKSKVLSSDFLQKNCETPENVDLIK